MGCSSSKLDDNELVRLCKDRKKFIKQAVEHRRRFASGHIAYIQSLKRVSAALHDYIEGDESPEFSLDFYTVPSSIPVNKTSSDFISLTPKSFPLTPTQSEPELPELPESSLKINYQRSGGNSSVSVGERPQSPEAVRLETYPPVHHYATDGCFAMQTSPMNSPLFSYSPGPPNNLPNFPPFSPQTSPWDFFWNPFLSLDYYGYLTGSNLGQTISDEEITRIRQFQQEEENPLPKEKIGKGETDKTENMPGELDRIVCSSEVTVENDNEKNSAAETKNKVNGLQSQDSQTSEVSKALNAGNVGIQEIAVAHQKADEETPGFNVYVSPKPTSIAEVIKELEAQFMVVCSSSNEVSAMLEGSRSSSSSNELTAKKMLNPVAFFWCAASNPPSSKFVMNSANEGYESIGDFSKEPCFFFGSHQSTLERLYVWERKLCDEVRSGERFRIAYEKKCMQFRNQDVKVQDSSTVDKARAAIRDLHTQINISMHSVAVISKRIETLMDEELRPQLLELIQRLARMWKVMAECHRLQKHTLDEAKLLLAATPLEPSSVKKNTIISPLVSHWLARSAAKLEAEIQNWKACFEAWITSQRSYLHALNGWLLRCIHKDSVSSKSRFAICESVGSPSIVSLCNQWCRFLDSVHGVPVLEGLDFFITGVGSLRAQLLRADSVRTLVESRGSGGELSAKSGRSKELVEAEKLEEAMTAEKMAAMTTRVLCVGMSVTVSSLTDFAIGSAQRYTDLVMQWENDK